MGFLEQVDLSTLVLEDSLISDDPNNSDENDDDNDRECPTDMLKQPICDDPECEGTDEVCQKVRGQDLAKYTYILIAS
jgi:hypothetical protein